MKILDLFSGIGGFSLAAHWMGWETVAFVEQDKFCQRVLRKNFGADVDIYDDIFTFSGEPFRERIDIITGGFPCQGFSVAGKRKGRNDERHLWPEMLRVIREVRPRFVVAENVRGLLSIESGQVFAEIIASLESEGYEVITFCIPASAVKAPHRRDRLWIVAPALDGEYRAHGRPQSEADGIQGIGGAKRLSGRVSGADSDVADTDSERLQGGNKGAGGTGQSETGSGLRDSNASDARRIAGTLRQQSNAGKSALLARNFGRGDSWDQPWIDVAARTCVRRMDDGLSSELDIIGSRDNRVARLKALGNAIVPQIALEIFKAIDAASSGGVVAAGT